MSSTRRALPLLTLALVACGARSTLAPGDGAPGTGGASSTTSASTASGGALGACTAWRLVPPVVAFPSTAPGVRAAEMSLAENEEDLYLTLIEAQQGAAGVLRSGRLRALAQWPPDFVGQLEAAVDVRDYVTGEGGSGPVALIARGDGHLQLATTLLPEALTMPLQTPGDAPLFVAGIPDRWIYGAAQKLTSYDVLDVGSYQTGSLQQSTGPTACVSSTVLGAAVPAGQGFVAVYALPNPPSDACDVGAPKPATVVTFYRHDSPTAFGSSLTATEGEHLVFAEPLAKLLLAGTPTGAWAVLQTDGSTAEQPPAVIAAHVDANGHLLPIGSTGLVVAPDGAATGPVAAAALGEGVAVAWADTTASTPTISVRTVSPGGSLGPITTFDTSAVFVRGRLRVIAARSSRTLVVTWDGGWNGASAGVARLDCAPGG